MEFSTLLQFFPPALRALILADDISDVMINEDGTVFIARAGVLDCADGLMIEPAMLVIGIQNVARLLGGDIDATRPILDTRLPDGSRVAANYHNGSMTVTIRKFNRWYSTEELIQSGCLPAWAFCELLAGLCSEDGRENSNVLISGSTGAGKSTLAKALIDKVPLRERLIVIEKPRELAISHPNAVRWEASDGVPDQTVPGGWREAPKSVAQLLAAALRHRPDRIIIGEVREPLAAYELVQALNTGHAGSISTIHADSAEDALIRLTDLVLASHSNLAYEFVEQRVLRSLDYVVHIARQSEGRKVTEVLQVRDGGETHRIYAEREKEWSACH